ncbi:MAG: hypothetical protein WCL08_05040, partial [Verrucomicrobiota bacterium]
CGCMRSKTADLLLVFVSMLFLSSLLLFECSCSAVKHEFGLDVKYPTATPGHVTPPPVNPPISQQLAAAADITGTLVPTPYGTLAAAVMNLLATGAAAFATFRARNAALTSREAAEHSHKAAAASSETAT